MITNKRIIYINSANRLSGSSSAFSISVQLPQHEDYNKITVLEANIPISYYLIPAGYNTFQLKELSTTVTITIPAGNYNVQSFANILTTLLNINSPNSWVYSISYNNGYSNNFNGLYTFNVTGNSGQPTFIFNSINYLNEQFGFNQGSTVTFASNTLVSTNVVNFVNETVLLIHSDIATTGYSDVLQGVYQSNNSSMSYLTYQATAPLEHSKFLTTNKNQIANFYLTDANNTQINLNGQDIVITILLYKEPENITDFLKKIMKYLISTE